MKRNSLIYYPITSPTTANNNDQSEFECNHEQVEEGLEESFSQCLGELFSDHISDELSTTTEVNYCPIPNCGKQYKSRRHLQQHFNRFHRLSVKGLKHIPGGNPVSVIIDTPTSQTQAGAVAHQQHNPTIPIAAKYRGGAIAARSTSSISSLGKRPQSPQPVDQWPNEPKESNVPLSSSTLSQTHQDNTVIVLKPLLYEKPISNHMNTNANKNTTINKKKKMRPTKEIQEPSSELSLPTGSLQEQLLAILSNLVQPEEIKTSEGRSLLEMMKSRILVSSGSNNIAGKSDLGKYTSKHSSNTPNTKRSSIAQSTLSSFSFSELSNEQQHGQQTLQQRHQAQLLHDFKQSTITSTQTQADDLSRKFQLEFGNFSYNEMLIMSTYVDSVKVPSQLDIDRWMAFSKVMQECLQLLATKHQQKLDKRLPVLEEVTEMDTPQTQQECNSTPMLYSSDSENSDI